MYRCILCVWHNFRFFFTTLKCHNQEIGYFILPQIYYSLGCHYFWHDDISRAHSRFKRCTCQLSLLSVCPSLVDQAQLRGLECACVQVRQKRRVAGENSEREDEDEEEDVEERGLAGGTLLEKLEHCRISDIEV